MVVSHRPFPARRPAAHCPGSRFFAAVVAVAAVTLTACAGEDAALPEGTPASVVARAPDATFAAGEARVVAASPDVVASSTVNFARGTARVTYEPPATTNRRLELRDPIAVIDLVRGATDVDPYGGSEVRGASTMRYQVKIDAALALARTDAARQAPIEALTTEVGKRLFFADVYIDRSYRVRRVTIPVDYGQIRPRGRDRSIISVITIDFSDFPES